MKRSCDEISFAQLRGLEISNCHEIPRCSFTLLIDGLVIDVPSAKTKVGTVRLPLLIFSMSAAASASFSTSI